MRLCLASVDPGAYISVLDSISTVLMLCVVLIDVTQTLREAGLTARGLPAGSANVDALVVVGDGEQSWTFAVEVKGRAPYPNEVSDLESRRLQLVTSGQPLLVAPFVTEGAGERLAEAGWSWADTEGNLHLRAPGLVARQRRPRQARQAPSRTIPQGIGGLGIIRSLLGLVEGEADPLDTTGLARRAGVTQPRATQVLGRLRSLNLVTKEGRYWCPNREALLDRFLSEYRGPGGSERLFYSLAEPSEVAGEATRDSVPPHPILVSADVGPDLHAPWLKPRVTVLYSRGDFALEKLGLIEAVGRADANVIVRHPRDVSVFAHSTVGILGEATIPVVDVAQMIWDLEQLGGTDRLEAAGELRRWLLNR